MPVTGPLDTPTPEMLLEHAAFARALARSLVLDDAQADDVVQEAWATALARPPRHAGNLRSWLGTLVRNLALRSHRGEERRTRREEVAARRESTPGPDEISARLEIEQRLVAAVAGLGEPYRTTIVLRYFEELEVSEIARRTDTPVETVRTRVKRALERIRARLDGEHGGVRRTWQLALLPLARGLRVGVPVAGASTLIGGALMSTKTALLTGSIAVAAVALLVFLGSGPDENGTARSASRSAAAAGRDGAGGGTATEGATDGPAAAAEAAEARSGVALHGLVRDARGTPLSGARVAFLTGDVAWPEGQAVVATDDRGAFVLPDVPRGQPMIGAVADGFAMERRQVDVPAAEPAVFTLKPGAPLRVVVLDPVGRPVANAALALAARQEEGMAGFWSSITTHAWSSARTDETGRADLGALPAGRFQIEVDDARYAPLAEVFDIDGTAPVVRTLRLEGGGVIEGRVFAPSGEPVPDALVRCGPRSTRTGPEGRYRLEHVGSMPAQVVASAEGHAPGEFGESAGWDRAVEVRVATGERLTGVDITLRAAFHVVGRLVDPEGNPAPRGSVIVWLWGGASRQSSAECDTEGRFRCGPFARVGQQRIQLFASSGSLHFDRFEEWVPGEGAEFDVGTLEGRAGLPLRGRVVDGDGRPVPGASVRVLPNGTWRAVDGEAGFEFPSMQPGTYVLQARVAGGEPQLSGPTRAAVGADAPPAELVVAPAASIRGRVVDTTGAPVADVWIDAIPADGPVPPGGQGYERTGADGTYVLDALPRGLYLVGIGPGEASASDEDRTAGFRSDIEVREVQAGSTGVDFVLPVAGATLEGRVVSARTGLPLRDYSIRFIRYEWFVPNDWELDEIHDAQGAFSHGVEEAGVWAVEVEAPGHVKLRTTPRRVAVGKKLDFGEIRLGEGARIEGTVRDAQGRPVPFARIHLLSAAVDTNEDAPFTDAGGRYSIAGVPPGLWNVFAVSPDHPLAIEKGVKLEEGKTATADFALADPAPVEIVVVDAQGGPVAGADVVYAFEAIAPLNSRLIRGYVPERWGPEETDAEGRCVQRAWPAAPITITIEAEGFVPSTRVVDLAEGGVERVEFRLVRLE